MFENAVFGDIFLNRNNKQLIYHKAVTQPNGEIYHYLIEEPQKINDMDFIENFVYAPYDAYVEKDGKGYPECLKVYDLEDPNCPNYGHVIISKCNNVCTNNTPNTINKTYTKSFYIWRCIYFSIILILIVLCLLN